MKAYITKAVAKLLSSYRHRSSLRNFAIAALWSCYMPQHRTGTITADASGIIAPNGSLVRYGTFRYWWYCVFG